MTHVVNQQATQQQILVDFQKRFIDLTTGVISAEARGIIREVFQLTDSEINRFVNDLTNIVQSLNNKRVPVRMFSTSTLKEMFNAFNEKADHLDCEIPVKSYYDLFDLAVAHGYDEENAVIRVYITAGCIPKAHKVPLYELMPFPLINSLVGNLSMIPAVREKTLLAYSNENQYREYSKVELGFCKLQLDTYICKDRNYLRTDTDASCLAGLYTQNTEIVARECLLEFSKPTEQIYAVAENTWLVHSPKHQTIEVRCESRSGVQQTFVSIKRMGILRLHHGCRTKLGRFDISTDANPDDSTEMRLTDWMVDPEDLFPANQLSEMVYRAEELQKADMDRFTTDDIKVLDMTSNLEKGSNLKIYIMFGLCGAIFIVIAISLVCICKRFTRQDRAVPGLFRSYHRSYHEEKPDIADHDPLFHVSDFEALYNRLMKEGAKRLKASTRQIPFFRKAIQSFRHGNMAETDCERGVSFVRTPPSAPSAPSTGTNIMAIGVNSVPNDFSVQTRGEQVTLPNLLASQAGPLGRTRTPSVRRKQPKVSFSGETKKSVNQCDRDQGSKYGCFIHPDLMYLGNDLQCIGHDPTNGCYLQYLGSDTEAEEQVKNTQYINRSTQNNRVPCR